MTFPDFIDLFNRLTEPIVVLEGKRLVRIADETKLVTLGITLAKSLPHVTFRSGNAPGADELFMKGVMSVAPDRTQVIKPYRLHRRAVDYRTMVSMDELNLVEEPEIIYATKAVSKNRQVDRYASGERDGMAMKGAYLLRDTIKIVGSKQLDLEPANFAIIYEDLDDSRSGGTGHTIKVCEEHGVLVLDQRVWFEWLSD